jgi:pimeloyl-ACP methyl ester carboxylesterase
VLNLAYSEYGRGQPLIIIHGLFGSSSNWRSIARRLAGDFHVYTVDLRNHGRSPWRDDMSYHALAMDIANFITTHNLHGSHVMGHSLGGKTAMVLALQYPDVMQRLAILDIAPVTYAHTQLGYINAMQALNLSAVTRRTDADAALRESVPDTIVRQFLLQNLVQNGSHFEWRINLDALANYMDEMIAFPTFAPNQFRGPTLLLYGMDSDYVLPEHHNIIHGYFPMTQIVGTEHTGHWLHVQQPNAVVHAIGQFLGVG